MKSRSRFRLWMTAAVLAVIGFWYVAPVARPRVPVPVVVSAGAPPIAGRTPAVAPPRQPNPESQAAADMVRAAGGTTLVTNDGAVRAINLTGCQIKDDDLRHLSATPRLTLLNLDGSTLTDEGLQYIRDLPELATLRLCRTQITDDGLANIDNLPKLTAIVFDDTAITDAGLLHLVRLDSLTSITCLSCPVSARAQELVHQHLPNCRVKH